MSLGCFLKFEHMRFDSTIIILYRLAMLLSNSLSLFIILKHIVTIKKTQKNHLK